MVIHLGASSFNSLLVHISIWIDRVERSEFVQLLICKVVVIIEIVDFFRYSELCDRCVYCCCLIIIPSLQYQITALSGEELPADAQLNVSVIFNDEEETFTHSSVSIGEGGVARFVVDTQPSDTRLEFNAHVSMQQ